MFYMNGQFVEDLEAKISILDLGLVRGYGVFDYLRTYRGLPFHLKEHLLRLKYSGEYLGIHLPHSLEEIEKIIKRLLDQNGYLESSIKIILTGGVSPDQITPQETASLIILIYPLASLPKEDYHLGIITMTTPLQRSLPTAKTLHYAPAIMALQQGRYKNAKEILYLNANHEILEASTSNFFGFTKKGVLLTCDSEEILLGITREIIIKLAKEHFPVELRAVNYAELNEIEESFITSSNKEILPVVQIDDQLIGSGKIGPFTQKLMHLFYLYTSEGNWPDLNISRYKII